MKPSRCVIEMEKGNEDMIYCISATNMPKDTMLVVPDTRSAVVMKDGRMMETLNGGKYPLFDPKSEKKSESISVKVIYLSKTAKLKVKWGTPEQFLYRDSEFDLPIRVGARGEFEVQIAEPRKVCLELLGDSKEFNLNNLQEYLITRVLDKIEPAIAEVMMEKQLSFDQIAFYKQQLTNTVYNKLSQMFEEEYGLKIFSFTFESIFANEDDAKVVKEMRQRKNEEKKQKEREDQLKQEQREKDHLDWERQKYLYELRRNDYEEYLKVCKEIGWNPEPKISNLQEKFCPNCGKAYQVGTKFCPNCGCQVSQTKKVCSKCGKEHPATAKFCSECGEKL